jgi:hypothetical protein
MTRSSGLVAERRVGPKGRELATQLATLRHQCKIEWILQTPTRLSVAGKSHERVVARLRRRLLGRPQDLGGNLRAILGAVQLPLVQPLAHGFGGQGQLALLDAR